MPENFNNPSTNEQNPNDSWDNMDTKAEANNSEPGLADRIRSKMTLAEINELDIKNLPDAEYEAVKERVKQFRETGNAGPIVDESTKVVEEKIEKVEQIEKVEKPELSPEVQELKQKAEKHSGFAGILNKVKEILKDPKTRRKVGAVALAAATAAGAIGFASHEIVENLFGNADSTRTETEESIEDNYESLTGYNKLDKLIDGSYEQDGNLGCFESEGKVSESAVGNPGLALEKIGVDPANATPEERGVVSEYMTYSMKYPAGFQAIAYGLDGFEGLSLNEAEDKIANMSDEEKAELQKQFQKIYENSEYSEEIGQGMYKNHGVAERADGRHSYFVESDLTGKNILVRETKLEDGTTVITKEKEDCANMLTEIEYRHPDGTTTVITINTPDEPTPGKGDPGEEKIKPKDDENLKRIDKNIQKDMADDIGTEEVVVHQEGPGERTDKPSSKSYQGTEPKTTQNESSKAAEPVTVSPDNGYSQDKGGANSNESAPVQENTDAQQKANESVTPPAEVGDQNALGDLGIN